MYRVIVCPNARCRGVSIVKDSPQQTECSRCRSSHVLDKFRTSYRADDMETARAARTKLVTKIRDDGATFDELKEMGALNDDEVGSVFDKQVKSAKDEDTRTPQEKIQDAITESDPATKETIIAKAESYGMSHDKSEKLLDRILQKGHAIESGDEITLL